MNNNDPKIIFGECCDSGVFQATKKSWRISIHGEDKGELMDHAKKFLFNLSNGDREDFLKELLSDFCSHCFTDTREHGCQCWNDE